MFSQFGLLHHVRIGDETLELTPNFCPLSQVHLGVTESGSDPESGLLMAAINVPDSATLQLALHMQSCTSISIEARQVSSQLACLLTQQRCRR